jgi:hypothetical protein
VERNVVRHRKLPKGALYFHLNFKEDGDKIEFGTSPSKFLNVFQNITEEDTPSLEDEKYPLKDELQNYIALHREEWLDDAGPRKVSDHQGRDPVVPPEDFTIRQAQLWRRAEKERQSTAAEQSSPDYENNTWKQGELVKLQNRIGKSAKERNAVWREQNTEDIERLRKKMAKTVKLGGTKISDIMAQQLKELTVLESRGNTAPADWQPRAPYGGPNNAETSEDEKTAVPKAKPAKKKAKAKPKKGKVPLKRGAAPDVDPPKPIKDPGTKPKGNPKTKPERNALFKWEKLVIIKKLHAEIIEEDRLLKLHAAFWLVYGKLSIRSVY